MTFFALAKPVRSYSGLPLTVFQIYGLNTHVALFDSCLSSTIVYMSIRSGLDFVVNHEKLKKLLGLHFRNTFCGQVRSN